MRIGANTFGRVNHGKKLITDNQSTNDLVNNILKYHQAHKPEYDKGAAMFWDGDVKSTGRKLFDTLKENITNRAEPRAAQTIKSPGRLLYDGIGDCKHYASFVAGVADALKRKGYPIDVFYRFASYRPGVEPHHVFAVLVDEDGREYWVDPVLSGYNLRKQPTRYMDRSTGSAAIGALHYLSGVESGPMDMMSGRRSKAKKAAKAAGKSNKEFRKGWREQNQGKGIFRKAGQAIKKVGLAANRNSFLLLLKMNLFRLASKMKQRMNANPAFKDKLAKKWKQLGGNPNQLFKDIDRGVKVWNKHHKNKQISGADINASDVMYGLNKYGWAYDAVYLDDVGFCVDCRPDRKVNTVGLGHMGEPTTIGAGAIIAAASTIIAAFAPLLKGEGIDTANMTSEAAAAEDAMYQEEAAEAAVPNDLAAPADTGEPAYTPDAYAPEYLDDEFEDEIQDEADFEQMNGIGLAAEDVDNIATGAKGLAKIFKRDPKKVAARKAKRATKHAPKVKAAPRKVKVVQKAIPLKARTLPTGVPVIEHGRPAWDSAVKASHGAGGSRGLQVNQAPEGGQGISDFFTNAKEWVTANPGTALALGVGSAYLLFGKKRRR